MKPRVLRALAAAAVATGVALSLHHAAGGTSSLVAGLVCLLFTFWAALILLRRRLGLAGLAVTVVGAQLLMHGLMGVFGAVALPEFGTAQAAAEQPPQVAAPTAPGAGSGGAAEASEAALLDAASQGAVASSGSGSSTASGAFGATGAGANAATSARDRALAAHQHSHVAAEASSASASHVGHVHAGGKATVGGGAAAGSQLQMLLAHALAGAITVILLRYGEAALRALPAALLRTVARIAVLVPVRFARPRIRVRPADAPRPVLPALTLPRVLRGPPAVRA